MIIFCIYLRVIIQNIKNSIGIRPMFADVGSSIFKTVTASLLLVTLPTVISYLSLTMKFSD